MKINAKQIAKMYNILDVIFNSIIEFMFSMVITSNGFAVGDVALSLEYVRAPYCLLRVMCIS